jgi:hypothetical protein
MTSQAVLEIPKIETTKEYAKFKLMTGNRPIDYNHVKRLKRSMQEDPQLFPSNPIQVNENGYIIDGQHRRQAAQELDIPVYYIVNKGSTLDETRVLNVTQRRWTLIDFAESFAASERKDYRTYLAGGQKHQLDVDFRRGEFTIPNEQEADWAIMRLQEVIDKTHAHINAPMAHALRAMFLNEDFDYELFMEKLGHEGARELFRIAPSNRACLRSIEDAYNFGNKIQKRLY